MNRSDVSERVFDNGYSSVTDVFLRILRISGIHLT